MAGVKGKSGGKREGAGRKRVPAKTLPQNVAAVEVEEGIFDPRPTLEQIAKGLVEVSPSQLRALLGLLPYVHTKKGEGGKKDQRLKDAEKVAGRFSPAAAPKLAAVGGRKV